MRQNEEVLQRVDALAEKIGVGSGHVWEFTVQQQVMEGWLGVVACFFLALVAWGIISSILRGKAESLSDRESQVIACIFIFALSSIAFIGFSIPSVGRIVNPEYYAATDIASMIGKITK